MSQEAKRDTLRNSASSSSMEMTCCYLLSAVGLNGWKTKPKIRKGEKTSVAKHFLKPKTILNL